VCVRKSQREQTKKKDIILLHWEGLKNFTILYTHMFTLSLFYSTRLLRVVCDIIIFVIRVFFHARGHLINHIVYTFPFLNLFFVCVQNIGDAC